MAAETAPADGTPTREALANPYIRPAQIVMWGALIPLVAAALVAALGGLGSLSRVDALDGLVGYGALLLCMAAGVRLGAALRQTGIAASRVVVLAFLGAGAVALFIPVSAAAALLAAAHAAAGAWDVWSADRGGLPSWYGRLRLPTAGVASLTFVAGFVVTTIAGA